MSCTALCPILLGLVLGELMAASAARAQEGALPPAEGTPPDILTAPRRESTVPRGNVLTVPIGGNRRLQMKNKQPIETVINEKENVATITPVPQDPTIVNITGREAGTTTVTLTGTDKSTERYQVIVQLDVEYLRSVLQRAAPTASLELIPAANGTIIIGGSVARASDIDIILRTAVGVAGSPDRVINALRVEGVMQVQLDVVVASVQREELRHLQFEFVERGQNHTLASFLGAGAASVGPLGTQPASRGENVFLGLFNNKQDFLGFLTALRNENLAKILSQPKLMTLSGRSASILSGGEQAIPEPAGLGVVGVRFESFGTRLDVLPIVLGNGKIRLEITPEVSTLDQASGTTIQGTTVPGRRTERVHTVVEMEDGQTLAIGGLIEHTVNASTTKIPVLGDLPFIGVAFSSKNYDDLEQELVVVVTPHLVDAMDCSQVNKVFPGQETRTPDDFELFLEGILEAPRGQREVCPGHHYLPAYKNGPTAGLYPCGGAGCVDPGPGEVMMESGYPVTAPTAAPETQMRPQPGPAPAVKNKTVPQAGPSSPGANKPAPRDVSVQDSDLAPPTQPSPFAVTPTSGHWSTTNPAKGSRNQTLPASNGPAGFDEP